jgi:hypothetical protein
VTSFLYLVRIEPGIICLLQIEYLRATEQNTMSYENIRVIDYSGYRDNERPRAFSINDEIITIVEILDIWIEENLSDKMRKRFFIVKTNDNQQYKIYIDEKTLEWFYEKK